MTYKLTNSDSILRLADSACIPADPANSDYAAYLLWLAEGNTPETASSPTVEQLVVQYEAELDAHLDSVARAQRFKDRHSLSLRAAYPNAWQTLGIAFGTWMDACNVQAYALMGEVMAGTKPLPPVDEFLAALPEFVAP